MVGGAVEIYPDRIASDPEGAEHGGLIFLGWSDYRVWTVHFPLRPAGQAPAEGRPPSNRKIGRAICRFRLGQPERPRRAGTGAALSDYQSDESSFAFETAGIERIVR
jgi:hypothetical protein